MILTLYNISLFVVDLFQLIWHTVIAILRAIFQFIIRPSKKPLKGETVLITGAARGLGRELALEFARRGAHTVLWDIDEERLADTANEVRKENGKVEYYKCDVSNRDAVKQTAARVWDEIGDVTMLINNAGIMPSNQLLSLNHQQIRRTIEINVMAHFWILAEFLPKMIEMNHGHVVAIASMAGRVGLPHLVPYNASKFAVVGMMDGLMEEIRYYHPDLDLHFTTVLPMIMNTDLVKNPRVKYPWLTPITEPAVAVKQIIDGVQKNAAYIYVPNYMEFLTRIQPLFPLKVMQLIIDFLDYGINPQD